MKNSPPSRCFTCPVLGLNTNLLLGVVNSDQLISFFAWHLLKQEDTHLFFIAGAVQIVVPFRATILTITAVFTRVSRKTVKFMHLGHASLFVIQTAVLSYLGTLLA